ncbi:MAG: L-seryl-tRNA(Sec) selenium transferase, partial [Chloroflexota bacterium]
RSISSVLMPSLHSLRSLPSVDELLNRPALAQAAGQLGHELAVKAARETIDLERRRILSEGPDGEERAAADDLAGRAARSAWGRVRPSLRRVINATGVVVHTNLGRAPLCQAAIDAVGAAAAGYSTLELDLSGGGRGERHAHLAGLLSDLLGTESAMVVNNNAGAVLLALSTLARGKEVILCRGQAVEIGGGFRVPDIMRRGGVRLVEVGTTNRAYLADYEAAVTARTASLLHVHSSNFKVVGFTSDVTVAELGDLSRRTGLPLLDDLGSGCLLDTRPFGLAAEPSVQSSVQAGSSLVCFSGDKLLGGPQAGIVAGRRDLVDRLKRDPLARAMRVDKLTIAALHATLVEYATGRALRTVPVWQMIGRTAVALARQASSWASRLPGASVVAGQSTVGGGSLPEATLPTTLLRLPRRGSASRLLAALRRQERPVIARIQDGAVVLDPRTVQPGEEEALLSAAVTALNE